MKSNRSPETLTSYIQSIVTGELCKRRHVVGVIRQHMGLLCDAPSCLLDALIVGVLESKNKDDMRFVFQTLGHGYPFRTKMVQVLVILCLNQLSGLEQGFVPLTLSFFSSCRIM